ncbi:MAG TPA: FimV/HubP family polar landmark protein [Methylophilaceae bacterium]|nr:FimV/HubP family polar landmark protein [Methylophilaceae bacterium]
MHKSKLRRITLAVYFALMPVAADAAGLGKLTVISGLGEPLNAEIELLSTTTEELSTLTAAIAPEEAYAVQGLERSALHNAIQVEVDKKPDGTPILKLSTRQPVSDPFLDMLIQVDWSTGRLLREYTVLLDPPGYSNNAASGGPAVEAPTVQASPSTDTTSTAADQDTGDASADQQSTTDAGRARTPSTASTEDATQQEYTTVAGDTLSSIAKRLQVEGVSLEQMLAGLYTANEKAFVGGNMNRLRVGQIIQVPSAEELQSISQTEAAQQVRVHSTDWNAYRNRLAGIVAESAPADEDTDAQTSGGKISTSAEDKAAPPATGPRDVVKLSKTDTSGAAAGDSKALQDRINALQEEVTAKEKATQEANERTAMLEKQIADMQKLLAIKSQSLAEMQKNASGATAAPVPARAEQNQPATDTQNTTPGNPATPEAAPTTVTPEAPVAAPATEPTQATDKPKKKVTPSPPPPIVEEPGMLDGLAEDPMLLAAAGGGVVLLGGGWLFLRNRRRRNLDSFEQGILTAGGLKANTVFGNTAGGTVDTGDTSFLTDFSQSGGGMIDTHDVDPIAEAEVYMAYGRDAQAEEILKDAIAKEPQRYELHLKLLEIIANRKDTAAFETIAGELYSTLGSNDPTWLKVAQMGQQLEPGNPLYDTKGASVATAAAVAAGTAAVAATGEKSRLDASDFDNAEEMKESSLDFSLGNATNARQPVDTVSDSESSSLDFDLGTPSAGDENKQSLSEMTTMSDSVFGVTEEPQKEASRSKELEFDLGTTPETTPPGTMQSSSENFGTTLPGLDLPNVPQAENQPADLKLGGNTESMVMAYAEAAPVEDMGLSFEMPDFGNTQTEAPKNPQDDLTSFSDTGLMQAPQTEAVEEIRFESAQETPSFDLPDLGDITFEEDKKPEAANNGMGMDFNFDNNIGESDSGASGTSVSFESPDEEVPNPPEIDLSGITLDFGPTIDNPEAGNENMATNGGMVEGESPEVDTKLDLVTAYMEMGDKEGARELLDEVLKEGGPQQKARAQEMLSTIG